MEKLHPAGCPDTVMSQSYTGACMRRTIAFSFTEAPRFVADCVCESCRKAHGASAVAWVGVKTGQFNLDRGDAQLRWYQSSEDSERGFCAQCGTRTFFRSKRWPGEVHMALACFDTPHNLVSTLVSFKEELPAWTALSERVDA